MSNTKNNVALVMIITIVSKCLGFLRDIVLADVYGVSNITDAYFVCQTIPEFLFSLVVQAVSIGFIPIYTSIKAKDCNDIANKFVNNIIKICLILSVLLIVVVNIFAREIVSVFASGFAGEKAELTVKFTRIIVFSMVFRITVAIYSAYLNSNGKFIRPALNGVILDIVAIASVFISKVTDSLVLVFAIIIATFLQFIMLFTDVKKEKPMIDLSLSGIFNKNTKDMISLMLPVALGVGASQINVLADRTMASSIHGAISSLNYANKVNNVVENIVILSLATVLFPLFAKSISKNDISSFKINVKKSIDLISFSMIPCSFVFFLCSTEIITVLFGRGAFGVNEIQNTSIAMRYYSLALVFLSYNVIITRALYAMKKVFVVSIISCFSVAVNITFNFLLKGPMGIGGLALATSISTFFATIPMYICLRNEIGGMLKHILPEFTKALVSSVVMAVVIILARYYLPITQAIISLIITMLIGGTTYITMEVLLKSTQLRELYKFIVVKAKSIIKKKINLNNV